MLKECFVLGKFHPRTQSHWLCTQRMRKGSSCWRSLAPQSSRNETLSTGKKPGALHSVENCTILYHHLYHPHNISKYSRTMLHCSVEQPWDASPKRLSSVTWASGKKLGRFSSQWMEMNRRNPRSWCICLDSPNLVLDFHPQDMKYENASVV